MNETDRDEAFARRLGELLQESADGLDGATRSRLTQARHRALAQLGRRSVQYSAWRSWAPAGALALAVLVTLGYVSRHGTQSELITGTAPAPALDDLLLLADGDVLDMGQDADFEFYEWAAGGGDGGSVGT